MRNASILVVICGLLASNASAAVLKSEELESFTGKVMSKVGKGDLADAFAEMKPYVIVWRWEVSGLLSTTVGGISCLE